jgi:hypothetical protein
MPNDVFLVFDAPQTMGADTRTIIDTAFILIVLCPVLVEDYSHNLTPPGTAIRTVE